MNGKDVHYESAGEVSEKVKMIKTKRKKIKFLNNLNLLIFFNFSKILFMKFLNFSNLILISDYFFKI